MPTSKSSTKKAASKPEKKRGVKVKTKIRGGKTIVDTPGHG